MIDTGRWTSCSKTVNFVTGEGVTHIDYAFATHYDADHIGCLDDLVGAGVTVGTCYDRGGSKDTQTFDDYAAACGASRQTASKGQLITMGEVTIKVVDLNGAGVNTSDENALGMVLLVESGPFSHVFPGDLEGTSPDVESVVGPEVGDVNFCKVTHHGSKFSNTNAWLDATTPEFCILSVGNNPYGHPTAEALGRLHAHGVEVYWTNLGSGAAPGVNDHICGDISISITLPDLVSLTC